MVHEIKDKNLFQLIAQSAREIGHRTISAYALMLGLFVVIAVTFVLAQKQQDIRQRAAEVTYINCDVPGFIIDSEESQLLSLINSYRQSAGARTLTLSSYLNRAAEWKALDMSKNNYIAHTDSLGRSSSTMMQNCGYPTNSANGENLAQQSNGSANAALAAWKKSPLHNDNLLSTTNGTFDPQYNWSKIGIARVYNSVSKSYYWATEFGYLDDGTSGSFIASTAPTPTPAIVSPSPTSQNTCVNQTPGTVSFNWTQQQSNMCYEIYYSYSGGSQTISAGCNISSYTQTGFSPGLVVTWKVRAFSGSNIGPYTTDQTFTVPSSCSITATSTPTAPTPTPTIASTPTPSIASTCTFNSSNNLSMTAGTLKSVSLTASNLPAGTTYLGFTSGTDKLFTSYANTIAFNSTMSLTTPSSVYSSTYSGGGQVFTLNINTTTSTPPGQYILDAIYLSYNGVKTQCTYAGLGGLVINVVSTATPTPTKAPTPTPTTYYAPTPTPTTTVSTYAPHLLVWNAYCSNGTGTIAFNWTGTNPYGYTLQWGSPSLGYNFSVISYAQSGTYYAGFSSNVNVEYQVWANNSSGYPTTPSDNGSFMQTTPSCSVAPPTPTPTPYTTTSSCPNYDPTTGYNNICSTNPCPGGSTLYKSGSGNAACAAAYGSTYGTCCMVTQPNGCPGGSIYTCRQSSCSYGETNLSSGNAACAAAYGWHTGYCCY